MRLKPTTPPKLPWVLLSALLVIGTLAVLTAFSLLSHQGELPKWGIIIAFLLGTFFISWTWALLLYLRWRDRRVMSNPAAVDLELLRGTVYGLVQGKEYQVMQDFTDYYRNQFRRGERLRFKERHFLPYHGGHTIIFDQRPLYLQEDDNEGILSNFNEYIAPVDQ